MSQEPGMGVNYIYFNMENGPTADIKVRKALQMAVDRDAMCAALYQYGECSPAYLPLPPASWGYDESLEDLVPKYDVKGAKNYLQKQGIRMDLNLNIIQVIRLHLRKSEKFYSNFVLRLMLK